MFLVGGLAHLDDNVLSLLWFYDEALIIRYDLTFFVAVDTDERVRFVHAIPFVLAVRLCRLRDRGRRNLLLVPAPRALDEERQGSSVVAETTVRNVFLNQSRLFSHNIASMMAS